MNALVVENKIYEEILLERELQDRKWGIQNHPSVHNIPRRNDNHIPDKLCRYYGIPNQEKAQYDADKAAGNKELTWGHIAVEELSEVISAENEEHRRHELIQLAAVCIAWVESIDRKKSKDAGK